MNDNEPDYGLLNIYEIPEEDGPRFLVAFLEPEIAQTWGFLSRAVVGEFTPRPDGEFDPETFQLNPEFVEAFVEYMNDRTIHAPDLRAQAAENPDSALYLLDPRNPEPDNPPSPGDLLGRFLIDAQGLPVLDSFEYNGEHVMFDPRRGPSGILLDRSFYDWLHPVARNAPRPGPGVSDLPIV